MPSYDEHDFPIASFYSQTAKDPLPTSFSGALGAYNGYPQQGYHFAAAGQPSYPAPLPPNFQHHAGYDRTYSPARFVQPSPHSQSYGFPAAPQSMAPVYGAPAPAPFGRRNSVDPPRAHPPVSGYSSLSGALDASVGPTRARSNSIQKQALASPYKTASKARRGSKPIAPIAPCLPDGPADHVRVPQEVFQEPVSELGYQRVDHHRRARAPLGIRLADVDGEVCPALEGPADRVFGDGCPYREIRLRVLWPGYPPFEKRVKPQDGRRSLLLFLVANTVSSSMAAIMSRLTPPKRGFEAWTLGRRPGGDGLRLEDVLITGIEHRGGANWQVEIYVPKRRMGIPH
ncbi:hypothetical protein FB451DRAFT_1397355 [Mycena latifolia]|nr:hypothetical protein FB451DRAFT_1397355 [Mycena latifolia]